MRWGEFQSEAASHSDIDPDGEIEFGEPANHGWLSRSDTSGRPSGSNTRISSSSAANPSVSSTQAIGRTFCSREVSRVLVTYDAPVDPIRNQKLFVSCVPSEPIHPSGSGPRTADNPRSAVASSHEYHPTRGRDVTSS